ncbi:Ulp1 protease family, C-terminal catalytic domain containing protein [Trema orientale]|uniref:Ulp1 protease family, C-terminal catalytic domain containing protein n=1 Tax=Trema orientale TaxID=63057 RepID=A0A2P5EST8_TREOI|nr:Ulp1 protease family, C-terminal catalytic domain containing protein [Trema orientale]
MKTRKNTNQTEAYSLGGFIFAFQVWAYECIRNFSPTYAERVRDRIPRILNWNVPEIGKYTTLKSAVFKLHVTNMRPTEEERKQVYTSGMFIDKKSTITTKIDEQEHSTKVMEKYDIEEEPDKNIKITSDLLEWKRQLFAFKEEVREDIKGLREGQVSINQQLSQIISMLQSRNADHDFVLSHRDKSKKENNIEDNRVDDYDRNKWKVNEDNEYYDQHKEDEELEHHEGDGDGKSDRNKGKKNYEEEDENNGSKEGHMEDELDSVDFEILPANTVLPKRQRKPNLAIFGSPWTPMGKKTNKRQRIRMTQQPVHDGKVVFSNDLLESPPSNLKNEFDTWILVGLNKMNKPNNKYPMEVHKKIDPPFMLGYTPVYNKEWFYIINEPYEWLSTEHVDVFFYYLRHKQFYNPELCKDRSTTGDCLFSQNLFSRCEQFCRKGFEWKDDDVIIRYFMGELPRIGKPWVDIDRVLFPMYVDGNHWILGIIDLKFWNFFIYDSMRDFGSHDKRIYNKVRPIARLIPHLLKKFNFFESRPYLMECNTELPIYHMENIPQQENVGDCGIFMLKFAECLIFDIPLENCTQERMSFFRNKMAVELYAHGKFKLCGIYDSNDEEQ